MVHPYSYHHQSFSQSGYVLLENGFLFHLNLKERKVEFEIILFLFEPVKTQKVQSKYYVLQVQYNRVYLINNHHLQTKS